MPVEIDLSPTLSRHGPARYPGHLSPHVLALVVRTSRGRDGHTAKVSSVDGLD